MLATVLHQTTFEKCHYNLQFSIEAAGEPFSGQVGEDLAGRYPFLTGQLLRCRQNVFINI